MAINVISACVYGMHRVRVCLVCVGIIVPVGYIHSCPIKPTAQSIEHVHSYKYHPALSLYIYLSSSSLFLSVASLLVVRPLPGGFVQRTHGGAGRRQHVLPTDVLHGILLHGGHPVFARQPGPLRRDIYRGGSPGVRSQGACVDACVCLPAPKGDGDGRECYKYGMSVPPYACDVWWLSSRVRHACET